MAFDHITEAYSTRVFNHALLNSKSECAVFLRYLGVSKDWARVTLREMQYMLQQFPDEQLFEAAATLGTQPKPVARQYAPREPKPAATLTHEEIVRQWRADPQKWQQLFKEACTEFCAKPALNECPRPSKTDTLNDIRAIFGKTPVNRLPDRSSCPRCLCK